MISLAAALAAAGVAAGAAVAFGIAAARARHRHRRVLAERGWLLERERQAAAAAAVDAERARIARDLHDIVSHHVSVMVVQTGAAREVLGAAGESVPPEVAEALAAVEGAGRDALTELRHLLGLLAPAADGQEAAETPDEYAPQPSLSQLSQLVDRIAFAGLPVDVRVSGEPHPLPTGIDVTAYRIIQEALTNVLKHGEADRAEVEVRYAHRYLRVEVLNPGPSVLSGQPAARQPADGAGRGLRGLRQRIAVYGGDLDARRRLGGGYRVRARIPLDSA
ncbi:sensor histidine kinase [Salinispora pacifica]|uniref:sensor histidine kinase n=1 Tax=Salinispora pacifica TaxID=351187 RepID=UPI00036A0E27|nr:histidine kinase [Salinispora pacifica]